MDRQDELGWPGGSMGAALWSAVVVPVARGAAAAVVVLCGISLLDDFMWAAWPW